METAPVAPAPSRIVGLLDAIRIGVERGLPVLPPWATPLPFSQWKSAWTSYTKDSNDISGVNWVYTPYGEDSGSSTENWSGRISPQRVLMQATRRTPGNGNVMYCFQNMTDLWLVAKICVSQLHGGHRQLWRMILIGPYGAEKGYMALDAYDFGTPIGFKLVDAALCEKDDVSGAYCCMEAARIEGT